MTFGIHEGEILQSQISNRRYISSTLGERNRLCVAKTHRTNVPSMLCACVHAHRSWDERTQENLECTQIFL